MGKPRARALRSVDLQGGEQAHYGQRERLLWRTQRPVPAATEPEQMNQKPNKFQIPLDRAITKIPLALILKAEGCIFIFFEGNLIGFQQFFICCMRVIIILHTITRRLHYGNKFRLVKAKSL